MHPDVAFPHEIRDAPVNGQTKEVPQLHVNPLVAFVLLFDIFELKRQRFRVTYVSWRRQLLHERQKFIMIPPVIEQLCPMLVSSHPAFQSCIPIHPINSILIPSCCNRFEFRGWITTCSNKLANSAEFLFLSPLLLDTHCSL